MGWIDDSGLHEGYVVPVFFDGQRGTGTTGGGIPDDQVACGSPVTQPDGSLHYPTRPAGEVTGWQVCCDCYRQDSFKPAAWLGPQFARVPSPTLDDPRKLRIYALDEDVPYVNEREDLDEVAVELWRTEHRFGEDALLEVEAASAAFEQARSRLDAAVLIARAGGASWTKIGDAVGISRQAARERWSSG